MSQDLLWSTGGSTAGIACNCTVVPTWSSLFKKRASILGSKQVKAALYFPFFVFVLIQRFQEQRFQEQRFEKYFYESTPLPNDTNQHNKHADVHQDSIAGRHFLYHRSPTFNR